MTVIVCDSSVLIDLAKARLLDGAFRLRCEFLVPDVMFADELIRLGEYGREDLLEAGLKVGELDEKWVGRAFDYRAKYLHLTDNDCFALVLAEAREGTLLTGDQKLREAAKAEGVEAHGLLWLCDLMDEQQTVNRRTLHKGLMILAQDPFVRLPRGELRRRIERFERKG